jgi:hypothetical protein
LLLRQVQLGEHYSDDPIAVRQPVPQLCSGLELQATGEWLTVLHPYLPVAWRVVAFRERYPHGSITTEAILLDWQQGVAIHQATVTDGEGGVATGTGSETRQSFADFVEKSETRAIGRALAALGIGTPFALADLTEGEHVADAPVANASVIPGNGAPSHGKAVPQNDGQKTAERLSRDQARALKALAQQAFGYAAGEARLRQDLGLEEGKALTLMRIAAHTTAAQYATLREAYEATLRQEVEADVP